MDGPKMKLSGDKGNFAITKTITEKPFVSLLIKGNERLFRQIKNAILGEKYNLSVVFVGVKMIHSLNLAYRGKDCPTDVLSFPLSKTEGEIFINLDRTKVEARKFGRKFENFVLFLLIHALCHLKGMTHGSRMETIERKFRNRFDI